jgi:hypothetical protein
MSDEMGWLENSAGERVRRTISFTDLPVSQGARDLYEKMRVRSSILHDADMALDVLAAADEKDVRNLLWARRVGKL